MVITKTSDIPHYYLYIHPKDLHELRRDIWCDEPVPAKLKTNNMKYEIDFAYRGSLTRKFPKKSYYVRFIKHASLFGEQEIHLNAEYADPSLIRNKLSLDFFRTIGVLSPRAQHVLLTLNGKFLGVYLQLESVNELFLQKRGLPLGPVYYAINNDANFSLVSHHYNDAKKTLESGYERKCGTKSDDELLRELIYKINTIPRSSFSKEIAYYIVVDKYFRWLAGAVCTQNYDGFVHNYALYHNKQTGLFELIPWDYDGTWGRDCKGKMMEHDYVPIEGYNTLSARLLDVPHFRSRYCELLEEILETSFTLESLEPKIHSLMNSIRPYLVRDDYKKKDIQKFDAESEYITRFIVKRNHYLRERLSDLKQ